MPPKAGFLVEIQNASLSIGNAPILKNISLHINNEEIVALVGESGSGKSISALTLLGLQPQSAMIHAEELHFNGIHLLSLKSEDWERIRGKEIGMVFQEPQSSLNPSMRCGAQLMEVLKKHTLLTHNEREEKMEMLLHEVQLHDTKRIIKSYPHELSGGQKQRIMIAMALLCEPKLLIADEPTTALDVTVQKEIILLLRSLQLKYQMSILFISHDLALVKQLANRVYVMYKGEIVESGKVKTLFQKPQHPYTAGLLAARPKTAVRFERLPTLSDFEKGAVSKKNITPEHRAEAHRKLYNKTPLLEVKGLEKNYEKRHWFAPNESFNAVRKIDFVLYPGEVLGLVGESGCGKSSLAKALVFLDPPTKGEVIYKGRCIQPHDAEQIRQLRKEIQFIFQDPYSALHPLKTIGNTIEEVIRVHHSSIKLLSRKNSAFELLQQVGLDTAFYTRYPHELSGGQRQRVVIARALATEPQVLICDESVAALDISIQAQVLNLLNDLKKKFGLSFLFISHDLAVVKYMSDRVMVMEQGQMVEIQEADRLYASPKHPYTKKLIQAIL